MMPEYVEVKKCCWVCSNLMAGWRCRTEKIRKIIYDPKNTFCEYFSPDTNLRAKRTIHIQV